MTIEKYINKVKFIWQSKILCPLNKHMYLENNSGIESLYIYCGIRYYDCCYCNRFKLKHTPLTSEHIIKSCLKQKSQYRFTRIQKHVFFEKKLHYNYSMDNLTGKIERILITE